MQLLIGASKSISDDACASDLLDTVPLVMHVIRRHLRSHRSGLTVPQFRTLWFVSTTARPTLSAVAEFIGLSLPAMSRMVDGLVEQKLLKRKPCLEDRRQVRLSISASGKATLEEARELAKGRITLALAQLEPEQKSVVVDAMEILRGVFSPESSEESESDLSPATE